MGWTIQHLPGRSDTRPYGAVEDALQAARRRVDGKHARALDTLLATATAGEFDLAPTQAGHILGALHAATRRPWIRDRQHLPVIDDLTAAADVAAKSRKPWKWS